MERSPFSRENPPEVMSMGASEPHKSITILGSPEQIGLLYEIAKSIRDGTLIRDMRKLVGAHTISDDNRSHRERIHSDAWLGRS